MLGAGFIDMINVEFMVEDPVVSVAVIPIGTPATVSFPTSSLEGVPNRVRVALSSDNHAGPSQSVYVIGRVEEKVDFGYV
jgi:hypothetical protein